MALMCKNILKAQGLELDTILPVGLMIGNRLQTKYAFYILSMKVNFTRFFRTDL